MEPSVCNLTVMCWPVEWTTCPSVPYSAVSVSNTGDALDGPGLEINMYEVEVILVSSVAVMAE